MSDLQDGEAWSIDMYMGRTLASVRQPLVKLDHACRDARPVETLYKLVATLTHGTALLVGQGDGFLESAPKRLNP